MLALWSPRGVIPGGRMGADVLGSRILVYSFLFQEKFIPLPQPQSHHGRHFLQGTHGGEELVPWAAGRGGRVGWAHQPPDVLGRLLSPLTQPGLPVAILVPVVDNLASHGFSFPLELPFPLLEVLAWPWLDPSLLGQFISF